MPTVKRPQTLVEVAMDEDFELAMSEFLDEVKKGEPSARIAQEPPLTGNAVRDAFLAAVAETLAIAAAVPVPSWTAKP